MKLAKANLKAGSIFAGLGGGLIGFPVGTSLGGGKPQWTLVAVGAGVILVGAVPFAHSANRHLREAVMIYNKDIKNAARPVSQVSEADYSKWVRVADSLYRAADYKNSGMAYSTAFKSLGWKGDITDRYNAACSWALASVKDSAFFQLERIVTRGNYTNYRHITTDKDLVSLHDDPRWKQLTDKVRQNKEKEEASFDGKLISLLDSLVNEDQNRRHELTNFDNARQDDQRKRMELITSMQKTDSLNYFLLKDIVKDHGFPNFDLVGQAGAHNFWLLIQHQDQHPQFQEEVLGKMKMEVDKGKASPTDYAYLIDRVKVNTGQQQIYGTQMQLNASETSYEPKNVIEPDKLNERRKSVGLSSIEEYIQMMNQHYFGTLKKK